MKGKIRDALDATKVLGPDKVTELKGRYGEIYELVIEPEELGTEQGLLVVAHKPNRSSFARFLRDSQANAFNAMRQLVLDCAVHPSADELRTVFEAEPGLVVTLGNKLAGIAKANLEVLEKKL